MCAYAASKHGIHGLTRVASMENAAHNVRVNTLAPGWTETPMVAVASAQNPAFAKQAYNRHSRKAWRDAHAKLRPQALAVLVRGGATSTDRCSWSMAA